MRKILSLLLILSFNTVAGLPPTTLNGVTTFNFKAPNVTRVTGGGLIEDSGSSNLLSNPNFEGGTTGWTCTVGTCTSTSTSGEFSQGSFALKVALSAQAMNVSQAVTIATGSITQHVVGVRYRVPTAFTDFQVCTTVNGAEKTCVPSANLILNDTYQSIEIPEVATPSQTLGIKFKTTSSYTGNAYFDAAYVKAGIGTQNLQLDNVYSAQVVTTSGAVSGENKDWIASCTAANPTVCTFNTGIFTTAPNCTVSEGDTFTYVFKTATTATTLTVASYASNSGALAGSIPFHVTCQKSGNDYLNSSAAVYSQSSANYDWTSYTPTYGGLGTVSPASNSCKHRRIGGDLEVSCSVTTGTVAASLASITLPSGLTVDTTKIVEQNTTSNPGQSVGKYQQGGINVFGDVVTALGTSTSTLYFGNNNTATARLTPTNGNVSFASASLTSINFRVPISGWTTSQSLTATLISTPKVPSYDGNVDTFIVSFGTTNGTTVCSASPCSYLDQIGSSVSSITRSSSGTYVMNTNKTYAKLKCVGVAANGSNFMSLNGTAIPMTCTNCNAFSFQTGVAATLTDGFGTLYCQGSY